MCLVNRLPFVCVTGSLSTMDYCLNRGDVTADDNHLRLCTVCSSTRSFGADMWPEYMNEATCSAEDNGCLFTDGVCKYLNGIVSLF